jgi:DNA-binding NtrC family response regulator
MPSKLLVVDDDADARQILLCVLSPVGDVLEAPDGFKALRMIQAEKPKVMVLDVVMPGMGGLAVVRAARELDPNIKILVLSGVCDVAVAATALERGASAYITKPFDSQYLRGEIHRLLAASEHSSSSAGMPWRVLAC